MKSLMAVSMHKAGSSIADRILTVIAEARGYRLDQLSYKLPKSALKEPDFFEAEAPKMHSQGVYYGIARAPQTLGFSRLPEMRVVMQLRDPRDCLTSGFYSFRESHVLPQDPEKRRAFEAQRADLQRLSVDAYVLQNAENYRQRMAGLQSLCDSHPDLVVLRYEDMVTRTEAWLAAMAGFLDQPLDAPLRAKLAPLADFNVDAEDSARHKRQVRPGDHARKLRPETIAQLNDRLGPVMRQMGYAV